MMEQDDLDTNICDKTLSDSERKTERIENLCSQLSREIYYKIKIDPYRQGFEILFFINEIKYSLEHKYLQSLIIEK